MKYSGAVLALFLACAVSAPVLAEEKRFDWAGFYAGGHVGAAGASGDIVPHMYFSDVNGLMRWSFDHGSAGGALVGAHVGANLQHEAIVAGLEADITSAGFASRFEALAFFAAPQAPVVDPLIRATIENRPAWIATVRGRAGIAHGRVLFYGTGGLSVGFGAPAMELMMLDQNTLGERLERQVAGQALQLGWNVGLGAEVMMNDRMSVRAEYLFHRFDSKVFAFDFVSESESLPASIGYDLHTVRLGASMHF